jgi:hypothetical protein
MATTTHTRTATKLAAFALALAAAVGGGAVVGVAVGPIDVGDDPAHEQDAPHGPADADGGEIHDEHPGPGWSH